MMTMLSIKRTPQTISITFKSKKRNRFNRKLWSARRNKIRSMIKSARISTLQKVQQVLEEAENA
jgi:hypothetical protein